MTYSYVDLVLDMLKLSKVKEGERVALLTGQTFNRRKVKAFTGALGAICVDALRIISLPKTKNKNLTTSAGPFTYDTLKNADMVINIYDISVAPVHAVLFMPAPPPLSMYSDEFIDILKSGTRWLDIMISEVQMRRLWPSHDVMERAYKGAEILKKADTIRITSKAGTDLTMSKMGRKGVCEVGVSDVPGRWDAFGFGAVLCAPLENSANGTLVLDVGDYIVGIGRDVTEPVKCVVEHGLITKIKGGFTAKILEMAFASPRNSEAYGVAHVGWGTHDKAVWIDSGQFSIADAASYYGHHGSVMQIAFGRNFYDSPVKNSGLGGTRRVPFHCDISLLKHDIYLDDEPMIRNGEIVHPLCK